MAHANAKLTLHGRRLIIERWEAGWTQAEAAESLGVSRSTVAKYIRRFRKEGDAGLADRSSRAKRLVHSLEEPVVEAILRLRRRNEVDVVLAHAVDRLSRNQNHIGVLFDEIVSAGLTLEFVTETFEDTAVGRFILAARAFVAEIEREKISERTMQLLSLPECVLRTEA